jgi:hypothetical protein
MFLHERMDAYTSNSYFVVVQQSRKLFPRCTYVKHVPDPYHVSTLHPHRETDGQEAPRPRHI